MLKALAGNLIILGIEPENIKRLMAGDPILVKKESLGVQNDIAIVFGKDRKDLLKQLRDTGLQLPEVPYIGKGGPG